MRPVDAGRDAMLRCSQETANFVESYRKLNADYDAHVPAFHQDG